MAGRGFCVVALVEIHAVTCPGVWLCSSGNVAIRVKALGSTLESRRVPPVFPLLLHQRCTFEKVFAGKVSLADLQGCLEKEYLYAELIQWLGPLGRRIVLASFETNLVDLLYPSSSFKGLPVGLDVDLLMEPGKHFPGIIAPKIEISTRTIIEEVASSAQTYIVDPKMLSSQKHPQGCRSAGALIRQRGVCHGRERGKDGRRTCRGNSSLVAEDHRRDAASRLSQQSGGAAVKERTARSSPDRLAGETAKPIPVGDYRHRFDSCAVCLRYKCYFDDIPAPCRLPTSRASASATSAARARLKALGGSGKSAYQRTEASEETFEI
ncbi:hypothetical protein KM043_001521 [Ampulex compressa]|nr:hypothetical protein KM043_001521 [Ampulex compressa]